jgi:hypothetical protein
VIGSTQYRAHVGCEIRDFDVAMLQPRTLLTALLVEREEYHRRAGSLKPLILERRAERFGNPIQISATTLDRTFDTLVAIAKQS